MENKQTITVAILEKETDKQVCFNQKATTIAPFHVATTELTGYLDTIYQSKHHGTKEHFTVFVMTDNDNPFRIIFEVAYGPKKWKKIYKGMPRLNESGTEPYEYSWEIPEDIDVFPTNDFTPQGKRIFLDNFPQGRRFSTYEAINETFENRIRVRINRRLGIHPETGWRSYDTREQQLARQYNTCAPYLGLENGLCRAFLEAGASATEFEGVKLLFPFVREAVLIQVPREQSCLDDWMHFAFFCGYDLGTRRPDLMPEVLPAHELHKCRSRLLLLQRHAGTERANGRSLNHAFVRVIAEKWPRIPPGQLNAIFAESAIKSLRAGFGAATIAQFEPELCDFYGDLPADIRPKFQGILWQSWIGAATDSVGLTVLEQLEHPVLRLARTLYPAQPTECATVQGFIREHLYECGVKSENDCPTSDSELIDWVAAGINYGQRVQQEQPEIVRRIFAESEGQRLEDALSVAQEVVAEAGGVDAVCLLPALKRWQKGVYDADEPRFYGEAAERVALFADFAVWIPWGLSQPPVKRKPKKNSGATGPSAQIELLAD